MCPAAAQNMFNTATSFNQGLADWDVSAVVTMTVRGRLPVTIAAATAPAAAADYSRSGGYGKKF